MQITELRKIQEGAQHFISDDGIIQFTTKEAAQKEAQKERRGIEKELARVKKANKELEEQATALRAEKDTLVAEKNTQRDEALAERELRYRCIPLHELTLAGIKSSLRRGSSKPRWSVLRLSPPDSQGRAAWRGLC